jgi:protoporphyrinogen oxidase
LARGGPGRAVVIGGGLAGLAAAARLAGAGWHVNVLEKSDTPGGRCRTVRSGDFLFDTGAQHFHDSYDDTIGTALRAGLGERFRIPQEPKGIYCGGRIVEFVPRALTPLTLLPWQALGIAGLLDVPAVGAGLFAGYRGYNIRFPYWWKKGDERTARDFLSRRATARYRRTIAEPVALYAGGTGLDTLSEAGFMVSLRCTFMDRTGGFTGGMGSLAESLAGKATVLTGMEATAIVREGKRATAVKAVPTGSGRPRSYKADAVICALPAPLVKDVVGKLSATAADIVRKTVYSRALTVNFALEGPVSGPGGPVLLPGSEGFNATWVCTNASKAAEYAPDGASVVTAVFCGTAAEELAGVADDAVAEVAREDCERVYGIGQIAFSHVVRGIWATGSGTRNLLLAGDWTMSPTVEGAVSSGLRAADAALASYAHSQ